MTDIATRERPHRETLYITDEELYRRMGVPKKEAREAIQMLDRNPHSGFPPKQKLFGGRRYWPALQAYFDRLNKVKTQ